MNLKRQSFEVIELHWDLCVALLRVCKGQVKYTFKLILLDISVFCKLACDTLVYFQQNVLGKRIEISCLVLTDLFTLSCFLL